MEYREYCLSNYPERCAICGGDSNIVVHHLDGNRSNNRLRNLAPLCSTHHALIHHGQEEYHAWVNLLPESSLIDCSVTPEERRDQVRSDLADDEGRYELSKATAKIQAREGRPPLWRRPLERIYVHTDVDEWAYNLIHQLCRDSDCLIQWANDAKTRIKIPEQEAQRLIMGL